VCLTIFVSLSQSVCLSQCVCFSVGFPPSQCRYLSLSVCVCLCVLCVASFTVCWFKRKNHVIKEMSNKSKLSCSKKKKRRKRKTLHDVDIYCTKLSLRGILTHIYCKFYDKCQWKWIWLWLFQSALVSNPGSPASLIGGLLNYWTGNRVNIWYF